MRSSVVFIILGLALFGLACGGGPGKNFATQPVVVASERPAWIDEEPVPEGGELTFVGISPPVSTEAQARDEAMAHAARSAVNYMGTAVKTSYERARISFGLASNVEDPTTSMRTFDKQLAANMVSQMRARKWHHERVRTPTGEGYVTYVLAYVPRENVDETYRKTAGQMADQAAKKAKEEGDRTAQSQLEKASEMWQKLQEQGLFDD
ncbi:hypothetical protein HQ520_03695 [bacterium]|nr:hypothetical protein [bacterium]